MKKELIKIKCSAEEIAREKAKYPEVIKDISRIYLTTPLGKYTFNGYQSLYIINTERVYTGNVDNLLIRKRPYYKIHWLYLSH